MKKITVVPAYGRDYANRDEAEKALREGKDFIVPFDFMEKGGVYINF